MKIKLLSLILLITLGCKDNSQQTLNNKKDLELLKDKQHIKELVDTFSILADKKDVKSQMQLFTDDAVVESYRNGSKSSTLKGKTEIGNAFTAFLSLFETVYHINGQQTVTINNNTAKGTSYCLVVLINKNEAGKNVKTTFGVTYQDTYVKTNNTWLIKDRKSYFNWEEVRTLE